MTTFVEKSVTCSVCGERAQVTIMGSTNQFGYPDLDLRPPEMARSTIWMWLQECPGCGYCAEDIKEVDPEARAIANGNAFIKLRESIADLHDVARRFRTAAFIAAERGFPAAAFQHTLHEAWVHDDCQDDVRASAARLNAVDHINQAHRDQIRLYDDEGADAAMIAELLRRAGEFQRGEGICRATLDDECADHVRQILRYELELCSARDAGCHTMEEVFGGDHGDRN
jgi:hypothetical protein